MLLKYFNKLVRYFIFSLPLKYIYKLEIIILNRLGKGINDDIGSEVKSARTFLKKETKIIFDIGANQGKYTDMLLHSYPNARYFLFEPQKNLYLFLLEKFKLNNNVKIFNYAISDNSSQSKIYFDKEGSGLASLNNRRLDHIGIKFKKAEEVKLMQLNTIIKQELGDKYKVNFCKIDIEGHEFFVLKSIKNNFENYDVIQFEFGGSNIDSKIFFQDFWYLLKDEFDIYRICNKDPILIKEYKESDETFLSTNYLAVNKKL
tara:strand:+ start:645 stop:1424 length:780 start_codon:yes stop_codon:yes gene_type:complete